MLQRSQVSHRMVEPEASFCCWRSHEQSSPTTSVLSITVAPAPSALHRLTSVTARDADRHRMSRYVSTVRAYLWILNVVWLLDMRRTLERYLHFSEGSMRPRRERQTPRCGLLDKQRTCVDGITQRSVNMRAARRSSAWSGPVPEASCARLHPMLQPPRPEFISPAQPKIFSGVFCTRTSWVVTSDP